MPNHSTPGLQAQGASPPLAIDYVIAGATRRSQLRVDGGLLYWLEQRPENKGRGEIRRWSAIDGIETLTPDSLSVRSRVHEYGGGEFAIAAGRLVFTSDPDQRVCLRDVDGKIRDLLAPAVSLNARFADFVWHPNGQSLFAVRERHEGDHVSNDLVRLDLDGRCTTMAQGADFYAAPAVSPDGSQLAWLQWNHPNMPWDGTELWHAMLDVECDPQNPCQLAGGAEESLLQPGFTTRGELRVMSDRSGYWQLLQYRDGDLHISATIPGECAVAPWALGSRTWAASVSGDNWLIASVDGRQQLWRLPQQGGAEQWSLACDGLAAQLVVDDQQVFLLGSGEREGERVMVINARNKAVTLLTAMPIWPDAVAIAPALTKRLSSPAGDVPFHLYLPAAENPPLLVLCHSGPTSQALPQLQAAIQYWTSRGFAVTDINYRGSDGYGRRWRQSLRGQWGRADVTDCLRVIEHLLAGGQFDQNRVFARGNSAGALTVLQLLTQTTKIRAAAVRYPVVDLPTLAASSHKFEARYLDQLVGGHAALRAASPSQHVVDIHTPLLIQHGDADPVVPLRQAQLLANALAVNGIEHELKVYAGEGHGFRRADTLAEALETEWAFFNRVR